LFSNKKFEKKLFGENQDEEIDSYVLAMRFNSMIKLVLSIITILFSFVIIGLSIYCYKNSLITKGNLERIGLEGGYSSHKEAIEKMKEESKTDIPKIARKLATKLRNDEEYYLYLSNKCKKLYQELYTETKFKEKFNL
jgi:hypothetical protein